MFDVQAVIDQLNQQNEDVKRMHRDLRKQQFQANAFIVGAVVGAVAVTAYKIHAIQK